SQRRDDNTIGIYAIDQQTGQLTGNGFVPCGGTGPRDFNIDPSGKFLIVANQKSNNIVVFRIDKKSGSLTQKHEIAVPIPVSINFVTQE
ncbi:MAG: beta-propeller fold lactonase family protein, partial [Chitinophagaceae bacterium]|nr:beta-propeller fold lactonase family protein [Chitinophagaceae bacterium]